MRLTKDIKRTCPAGFRVITVVMLLSLSFSAGYSQSLSLTDTVRIGTVSVTALSYNREMPFSIISIDTVLREWNHFSDMGKLFQAASPVFVRRYGTDGVASLSIRGMSGSHTNVSWNGLNINAPMNGQSDFTLLPLFAADKITLTLGGGNLKNQSGTMGGSLDLSSSPRRDYGADVTAQLMAGSYGSRGGAILVSASNGRRLSATTKIWIRHSDNNFRFINENAPGGPATLRRVNAAADMKGLLQDIYLTDRRHALSAHLWLNDSFREVPSAVTTVQQDLGENQKDQAVRAVLKYRYSGQKYSLDVYNGFIADVNLYNYDIADIHGDNRSQTLASRVAFHYFGNRKLDVGITLSDEYQTAVSNSYEGGRERNTLSTFLSFEYSAGRKWFFIAQAREQMPDERLSAPELTGGVTFKPSADGRLLLKANISKNMRFPTLNDLFWNPGGNPQLRPEVSRSAEAGFVLSGQKSKALSIDLVSTLYFSNVRDLITWIPVTSSLWSPVNMKEVNLFGAEISAQVYYNLPVMKLKMSASYNYIGEQLIYTPANTCNMNITATYRWLKAGTAMLWNSRCYTTTDGSDYLFGYFLTDMFLGASLESAYGVLEADLSVNNVLNADYESVKNYPMPRRSLMINITIKPNL